MRGVFLLVCVLVLSHLSAVDKLITRDGHTFTGKAKTTPQGVLLETPYGTLRIPLDALKELRYDPVRHVFLTVGGQRVRVLLLGETPTAYRVLLAGKHTEFARGLVEKVEDVTELTNKVRKGLTGSLKNLMSLAKELEKAGLKEEWLRVLRAIYNLDPTNDYAGKNLGYLKTGGVWVKPLFPFKWVIWRGRKALMVDVVGNAVLSGADGKTTFHLAHGLAWLLPRLQKAFAIPSIPAVRVVLYSNRDDYIKSTGRKDAGFYDRARRQIILYASDGCVRTLYWLMAYHVIDTGLGLAPVVEGGKVKRAGAPLWFREGLALYLEGWALPFERGATSSLGPNSRIGVPTHLIGGLKLLLRTGGYVEPRALTRVPPSKLDNRCLLTAWAMVFCMLRTNSPHHSGMVNMLKALKNGKEKPSEYFDPFFDQTALKREVVGLFMRLSGYRGRVARTGLHKINYLWHEDALRLLQARSLDEAIRLYKRILQLAPNDYVALYNLACAYSLLNDKHTATRYLLRAWDAGFRDKKHIKNDPDLKNIRDTDIFKALTGQKKEF